MEREVGGGIGMGNTCKPMAVSFQCMTKFTTNKKKKKEKKGKKKEKKRKKKRKKKRTTLTTVFAAAKARAQPAERSHGAAGDLFSSGNCAGSSAPAAGNRALLYLTQFSGLLFRRHVDREAPRVLEQFKEQERC